LNTNIAAQSARLKPHHLHVVPMASRTRANSKTPAAKPAVSEGFRIKLQIAATVFLPMLALGLWLNSKGFFG
jgi:hypothetical protein